MEQQQEVQEEGISIIDILKLLLSKIKFLILAVLIGGILGGSFAVWKTIDVNHYGTKVEFYVNPEKPRDITATDNSQYGVYGAYGRHVMDNMIKLLGSESFAEQMILNGKPLPAKDTKVNLQDDKINSWINSENASEVALDLNTKIDAAQTELDKLNVEKTTLDGWIEERTEMAEELAEKKELLDELWVALSYKQDGAGNDIVSSASFSEYEYKKKIEVIEEGDPLYDVVEPTQLAYGEWDALRESIKLKDEDIKNKKEEIEPIQETTDAVVEEALEAWRQTALYQTTLAKYSKAIQFSYLEGTEDVDDVENLARSFIYVKIFVLNDEGFANKLLDRVKTVVPAYVEEKMTVPSGYVGTNCKRITRSDNIRLTNPGYTTNQAIKYGLLMGFVALVIACVIVLIVDKSDKRLRDTSVITKQFNVPLLGLIPTIDEINGEKKEFIENGQEEK